MEQIQVLIADDHKLFRDGVKKLLELESDIVVIGEAGDGEEALLLIREHEPDILLFDINMPRVDGIQLVRELNNIPHKMRYVAISAYDDEDCRSALSAAGVLGFVLKAWAWLWPKALAIILVLAIWQVVVWSGWRPEYVLPSPAETLQTLWSMLGTERFWSALQTTLIRAVIGFALALVIGTAIGILVARIRPLRLAVGSLITGLQTMPSIAWFPLAILLFGLDEQAILFVVVLGAAPSIANGVISGIDHVPPSFVRNETDAHSPRYRHNEYT